MATKNPENYNSCNNNNHADKVLQLMKFHLDNEQLCDVVLISGIDGKRLPVHRLVLSANSEFFSAMFSNPMREANDNEVTLGEVNDNALQVLVNYCYTGNLEVHDDNVEMLLTTAHRWQMDSAVTACGNFMARKLDPSNCLGISFIAEQHDCTTLMGLAVDYINKHFANVSQSQEFLQLSADQLGKLLSSDALQVPSEEIVFQSLMSWLRHEEPARKQHLPKLMAMVRLPLLKLSFIEEHVESVCIANDCQNLLLEAYKCQLKPERLVTLARRHPTTKNNLLAIGLCYQRLVFESYCPIQKQWTVVNKLNLERHDYVMAVLKNRLLLVGKYKAGSSSNSILSLDLSSMTLTQLPSMSTSRSNIGVAVLRGLLYVVGGHNGSYMNTVERWNPRTGNWITVAPMPTKRCNVGMAVLNECLYVIGGCEDGNLTSCVERYDPFKNVWSRLSPLNIAREIAAVAHANGLLYAVGGRGIVGLLTSVECYNPTIDKWTTVCSLSDGRYNFGCTEFSKRLIVAGGGILKDLCLNVVEEYDPVRNVWNKFAPLNTCMHSVCLVVTTNDGVKPLVNS